MEPVALIVAALAAGTSAGALDALKDDVKDKAKAACARVYDLVRRRFRQNAAAEVVLAEYVADPGVYEAALAKKLSEAGADRDAEILAAARELLELLDRARARAGKLDVTIKDARNFQVGDGNLQINM